MDRFMEALERVYTEPFEVLPLHEPAFQGNELEYVKTCIDTGWVSSAGAFVNRFEDDLAGYVGVDHAVAMVNGTAALHMALLTAGVESDDEVLMPALTFVATANAISYARAVPHFVDSAPDTLGVDPEKLAEYLRRFAEVREEACINKQTGRSISALIVVHTFGHAADLDGLADVCRQFNITLIEDAAEGLGTAYKGRHVGQWGRVSAFSFNGNKILTTGGGGALVTNDEELAMRARHLSTTAKRPHRWEYFHDQVGYNYRMPNINAALGCAQLEYIDRTVALKRALAERYEEAFLGIDEVTFVREPADSRSNYWLNAVWLEDAWLDRKEALLTRMHEARILARPAWLLMPQLPMYSECPSMNLDVAEDIAARIINLPSTPTLVSEDASAELELEHSA